MKTLKTIAGYLIAVLLIGLAAYCLACRQQEKKAPPEVTGQRYLSISKTNFADSVFTEIMILSNQVDELRQDVDILQEYVEELKQDKL